MTATPITGRALAMLRAVAQGRAELAGGREPDLRVDGLQCTDQATAHHLAHAGLVRAVEPGSPGQWVRAELTPEGTRVLALNSAA
ncbi:hypothetical protein [Amycolatopsis sp. FDAARGOS 1241]|uniref:hypothetical protein n=1 Tax=Amycolatopsis sp. FDAARGOS 1241 TaxID=2778070 RepID=UPI00194E75C7|nr:hypothetical protein [Amycolatopsis sp. FDAARGOS 1241]QRP49280.1 hypothetical protein I6J71_16820 [Amycolatopsis sp. FDAARGOS 1241]